MKPATLTVHAGAAIEAASGAVAASIQLSTTFQHAADGTRALAGFEYIREDHPNQRQLEAALAALEGGAAALAFASGMGAVANLLDGLQAPGNIVLPLDVYHGVRRYCREILRPRGFELREVDFADTGAVVQSIDAATRVVWIETPSNPQMVVADIEETCKAAHARGALVVVDNTFATPLLQTPISLGADAVMHSTSKYLAGHSDALGGALVFAREDDLSANARSRRVLAGAIASPFNAWLTLRGIRSLAPRMAFHCRNARLLASFLESHPRIERVEYPGLASHPGHALAKRQMRNFGGMMSVRCAGGRAGALAVASRLRLFTNATSLGGVESLVEHRHSIESADTATPDDLLRVSVGIEDPDDLIGDWAQALE